MSDFVSIGIQYIKSYSHGFYEALSIAVTSIVPIYFLSAFALAENNIEPTWGAMNESVWSILSEGDIGYLALSICGSIFFIYVTALRKRVNLVMIILFLISLTIVIFSAMIIARPPSESPLLQNPMSGWGVTAYIIGISIFIYCKAAASRDITPDFHKMADSGVQNYLNRKPADGR